MPRTDWGWLITPDELRSWILFEDGELLVVNKPGLVVCHPSKQGPWSSLIGACREYAGLERLHMPSRLDRETSGVVVLAKTAELGSRLQRAIQARRVTKVYHAILCGQFTEPVVVDQPLGKDPASAVIVKQTVVEGGSPAQTEFKPLGWGGGYTLAEVRPKTGRLHQIRAHAAWMGHAVAGDKIYGVDESLFLEFIEKGWTERLAQTLPLDRQALHATEWSFADLSFTAPWPGEWAGLLASAGIAVP